MKGRPIDQLVYECMFPKPKTGDPQSFQAFLQRSLVPEVRHETQAFYGHLTSQEAKYPGLDYSYPPHRVRLSRFPWHRRLFRAFDNLKLTNYEIATLTKWEGTRWAKERFEKEQGIIIRDTTGDGIEDWVSPELRPVSVRPVVSSDKGEEEEELEDDGELEENEREEDDGESDSEITSVGTALNERLRAAAAQREAGNLTAPMDEEWEQWLKDAVERGNIDISSAELNPDANVVGTRPTPSGSQVNAPPSGQFTNLSRGSNSNMLFETIDRTRSRPNTFTDYHLSTNSHLRVSPRLESQSVLTTVDIVRREAERPTEMEHRDIRYEYATIQPGSTS
ncbi:08bf909d-797a-4a64-9f7a-eb29d804e872-CDS [Sclerotinia trifoliorum]|uniref:08bf909d-797a-4a64-9f7a-eb29d804e872-CDS n=1 Tax=Sclerotinia trifoliorum TaxID=28548 RepID=A0A8H2VUL2_9HELO|nr:08bf909d-797a-4a64-9f7a-eb29d804e872-CDS [Sclerotinia trifoliorum]